MRNMVLNYKKSDFFLHIPNICSNFALKKCCIMRNIIVSVVALCLLMTGCNSRTPQYRIGVSQCLDDAWRQKMNYEMERELLLHPDMSLSRRIAYGSNELQCAQIDSFIKERVDLLIVSPNEAKQVQPAVTRAYRAGIPVIVADRRVPGDEWTAFIGGDNYKVGRLMAQWVIGKASDKGSKAKRKPFVVLEVAGLPGSTPATLRHEGMMEGIEEAKGEGLEAKVEVQSVMGRWYQENAYEVVSAYLENHPLPDVIVAHNDLMAIGAAEAVAYYQTSHLKSQRYVPIMGVDGIHPGLQAIVDGKIECSATYSSRGDMIIDAAARIIHKESYVRDTVLETTLVDITAAYPMLRQDEAITRDLETLHLFQTQTDSKWRQLRYDKTLLITWLIVSIALFLLAAGYIIANQVKLQQEIKQEILPQLVDVQEAIQLSHRDVAFADRLKQAVDDHLTDQNLSVEYLGSMLQLSRTQLFRRVKTVTGKARLIISGSAGSSVRTNCYIRPI